MWSAICFYRIYDSYNRVWIFMQMNIFHITHVLHTYAKNVVNKYVTYFYLYDFICTTVKCYANKFNSLVLHSKFWNFPRYEIENLRDGMQKCLLKYIFHVISNLILY